MKTFEFNGEKYANASKHQKEWGSRLISQLLFQGDETILDLGCGDGALTEQLASLVPRGSVLGIDASMGMIQAAEKHRADNLKFAQMDINHMNFCEAFDVIYSNAALHWVKDHQSLLQSCFKALKAQGTILWNFAGDGTCAIFHQVIKEKIKEEKYKNYFHDFQWPWYMPSKKEYEKLIGLMGFSEASVEEENEDRFFANAEEMIGWLDQPTLVPFITCVAEDERAVFRDEVIEEMLHKSLQADGTSFETFRRLKVIARK